MAPLRGLESGLNPNTEQRALGGERSSLPDELVEGGAEAEAAGQLSQSLLLLLRSGRKHR